MPKTRFSALKPASIGGDEDLFDAIFVDAVAPERADFGVQDFEALSQLVEPPKFFQRLSQNPDHLGFRRVVFGGDAVGADHEARAFSAVEDAFFELVADEVVDEIVDVVAVRDDA